MIEQRPVKKNCNFLWMKKHFSVALQKNTFTEKEVEDIVLWKIADE